MRIQMDMDNLLHPVEEVDTAYVEITDNKIILLAQQTEEEVEQEEEQVGVLEISKEEKMKSLTTTASLLDLSNPADRAFHRRIRELQMSLRMASTTRCTLDSWLL